MEFLDTAGKIKKLRKQLFMRQYELASEDVTSAFISMIELGKRGLKRSTAEKIAEKLKEKAASLGVSLDIDGAYLLLSPEEEAEKYCLEKLKEIKTMEEAESLLSICEKYHLEGAESRVRSFIGDIFFEKGEYEDAFEAYSYAIDLAKNSGLRTVQPYLYNRSGLSKLNIHRYKDAIFFFERAIHYAKIFNNLEIMQQALYSNALCYKKLEEVDNALQQLSYFFEIADKKKLGKTYIYGCLLKISCCQAKGDLDEGIEMLQEILKEFPKLQPELLAFVYNHLGELYLEKKCYVKSLENYNVAQKIRNEYDKFNLPFTMLGKAEIYIKEGFYEDAVLMIELALETAEQLSNKECLIKGYTMLREIYKHLNDQESLKFVYEKLVTLLQETGNQNELTQVTNILALLYLKSRDAEAARKCLEISEEFN